MIFDIMVMLIFNQVIKLFMMKKSEWMLKFWLFWLRQFF